MEIHLWDHLGRSGSKKNHCCMCVSKGTWLWTRGIPGFQCNMQIPLKFSINSTQTPNSHVHAEAVSFSTPDQAEGTQEHPGPTDDPGAVNQSTPARMTRQESCHLPFGCRSSSSLHKHWHNTHSLSGNSRFCTARRCCEIQEPF